MVKNSCFVGLELSSESVKAVTGFLLNDAICVLDMVEEKCDGLERGLIKNVDALVNSIRNVINKTSKDLNVVIKEVSLIVPPFGLLCISDTGSTNTIDGNDIIRHVDTTNILTAMRKRVLADPDLKIVDIVPDTFIIDNNERFDHEPLGKVSKVLSLHASIYAMNDKVVSQFESVVNKAGYEVKYKVNAPYASALYLSTIANIPNTYILVDIGESITTISKVHNKTSIIHSKMIKFGGRNITQEIAEQFNIDYDDAERLKRIYGIDYNPNFTAYIHDKIQLDDLADVILNVLKPLLLKVKSVINEFSIDNNERLPVVLSGGTSELHNINDIVEDVLETKVVKYSVESIGARDKSLISILGSIKYGAIQPTVDEEEIASTTINRVETNKKSKSYKFDEEL